MSIDKVNELGWWIKTFFFLNGVLVDFDEFGNYSGVCQHEIIYCEIYLKCVGGVCSCTILWYGIRSKVILDIRELKRTVHPSSGKNCELTYCYTQIKNIQKKYFFIFHQSIPNSEINSHIFQNKCVICRNVLKKFYIVLFWNLQTIKNSICRVLRVWTI